MQEALRRIFLDLEQCAQREDGTLPQVVRNIYSDLAPKRLDVVSHAGLTEPQVGDHVGLRRQPSG